MEKLNEIILKGLSVVDPIRKILFSMFPKRQQPFTCSEEYWINRYNKGGNSGAGSYNSLAEFKADVLNEFVRSNSVRSVIEFGCGDGNQLKHAQYPHYIGFDISPTAVNMCREIFKEDKSKRFSLMSEYNDEHADLTLSLDVIYHLVEDETFHDYMCRLFESSDKYVIIYSSNTDKNIPNQAPHVRHRNFTEWVDQFFPSWRLNKYIPNKYQFNGDNTISTFADFFVYHNHGESKV